MPDAPDLTLYQYASCPYCQRVRRALRDLELSVELRDTLADPDARAAVVEHTARGTVPVLHVAGEDGGTWMPESADIVRYLYDRFGDGRRPSILSMFTPMQKLLIAAGLAWLVWQALGA
ncbi:MAG: glutathione S-transferase N-terminal domain-containing protein [Myxococcota bacterium]